MRVDFSRLPGRCPLASDSACREIGDLIEWSAQSRLLSNISAGRSSGVYIPSRSRSFEENTGTRAKLIFYNRRLLHQSEGLVNGQRPVTTLKFLLNSLLEDIGYINTLSGPAHGRRCYSTCG